MSQPAIRKLHYHPKWFEYNLLPTGFFEWQVDQYTQNQSQADAAGDDWEHYRYLAFVAILESYDKLSAEQIEQYIDLCQRDEDQAMARAALFDLLQWRGLTNQQRDELAEHPAFNDPMFARALRRRRMLENLAGNIVSDKLFADALDHKDSVIERALVEHPGISREQLEVLAANGTSRAVRNIALNRLGRKV